MLLQRIQMKAIVYVLLICAGVGLYAEVVAGVALRVNGYAITLYEIEKTQKNLESQNKRQLIYLSTSDYEMMKLNDLRLVSMILRLMRRLRILLQI